MSNKSKKKKPSSKLETVKVVVEILAMITTIAKTVTELFKG